MTVKVVEGEQEIKELAHMLSDYWSERDLDYPVEWAEDYVREGHSKEIMGDKFFVETGEDGVSGSISIVLWEGGVAEIRDFYVVEGERDSGIGIKLLERVQEYCESRGVRKLHAKVITESKGFFEKNGFKEEGVLKDHFKEGEDLAVMAKFLQ